MRFLSLSSAAFDLVCLTSLIYSYVFEYDHKRIAEDQWWV